MLKCQTKMSNETHNLCVFLSACLQDISQDVSQLLLYLTDVWLSLYDFSLCSTLSWKWLDFRPCSSPGWRWLILKGICHHDFRPCSSPGWWWLILVGVSLYDLGSCSPGGWFWRVSLCTISGHVHLLASWWWLILKGISVQFQGMFISWLIWKASLCMISGCVQLLTDFKGCLSVWFQGVFNSWLILKGVSLYDFRVCSTPDWF